MASPEASVASEASEQVLVVLGLRAVQELDVLGLLFGVVQVLDVLGLRPLKSKACCEFGVVQELDVLGLRGLTSKVCCVPRTLSERGSCVLQLLPDILESFRQERTCSKSNSKSDPVGIIPLSAAARNGELIASGFQCASFGTHLLTLLASAFW